MVMGTWTTPVGNVIATRSFRAKQRVRSKQCSHGERPLARLRHPGLREKVSSQGHYFDQLAASRSAALTARAKSP